MNRRSVLGFGPHLTLDLYECNKENISNVDFIYKLLDGLPELIGMHKIGSPHVIFYPGSEESFDKGGVSAFVLIAESHITVHTFIDQGHVFVDIFSCKDFKINTAIEYLTQAFQPKRIDKNLFNRGVEFPKSIPVVSDIVKKERKDLFRKI